MLSLQNVLKIYGVPDEISMLIKGFLDIASLKGWRATTRQAFYDVEHIVRQKAFLVEQHSCVTFLQEPTGLFLGSAWFQFIINTYKCSACRRYEYVSSCNHGITGLDCREVEKAKLCTDCFIHSYVYSLNTKNVQCFNCKSHVCFGFNEVARACLCCNELFCDECGLENNCMYCQ
jgi:hypothetical protein